MAVAKEVNLGNPRASRDVNYGAAVTLADQLMAAFQREKQVEGQILNRIINRDKLIERVLTDFKDSQRLLGAGGGAVSRMFHDRDIFNMDELRKVLAEGNKYAQQDQDTLKKILGVEMSWKETLKSSIRNLADDIKDWGVDALEGVFGPLWTLTRGFFNSTFMRNLKMRGLLLWRYMLDRKKHKATIQSAQTLEDITKEQEQQVEAQKKQDEASQRVADVIEKTKQETPVLSADNVLGKILTDTRDGVLETWAAVDGMSRLLTNQQEEFLHFQNRFMDVFNDLPEAMQEAAGKETMGDWMRDGLFNLFGKNGIVGKMVGGIFGKEGLIAKAITRVGGIKNALGIVGMVTSGISGGKALYKGIKNWRAGKRDDETRGQIGKGVGTIAGQVVGGIIGSIVPGAGTLLGAGIGGWVGNIAGEYIGKNWVKIKKGVEKGWTEFRKKWDKGWTNVKEGLTRGWNGVVTWIGGQWNGITTAISSGWTRMVDSIRNGFANAWQWVGDVGGSIGKWVSNGWNTLINNIKNGLSIVWSFISGGNNPLVKAFQDSFSKVGEKLIASLKGVKFENIFRGAVGFILGPFKTIFKAIGIDVEKILLSEKAKDPKHQKKSFWDALTFWDDKDEESTPTVIDPPKTERVKEVAQATTNTAPAVVAKRQQQPAAPATTPRSQAPKQVAVAPQRRGMPTHVEDVGLVLVSAGGV